MESNGNPSHKCRLIFWSNPGVRNFWQKVNTGNCSIGSFLLRRPAGSGVFMSGLTPILF